VRPSSRPIAPVRGKRYAVTLLRAQARPSRRGQRPVQLALHELAQRTGRLCLLVADVGLVALVVSQRGRAGDRASPTVVCLHSHQPQAKLPHTAAHSSYGGAAAICAPAITGAFPATARAPIKGGGDSILTSAASKLICEDGPRRVSEPAPDQAARTTLPGRHRVPDAPSRLALGCGSLHTARIVTSQVLAPGVACDMTPHTTVPRGFGHSSQFVDLAH
jgi:hypothetical protein